MPTNDYRFNNPPTLTQKQFDEFLRKSQYGVGGVPYHVHNGADSARLPQLSLNNSPARIASGTASYATADNGKKITVSVSDIMTGNAFMPKLIQVIATTTSSGNSHGFATFKASGAVSLQDNLTTGTKASGEILSFASGLGLTVNSSAIGNFKWTIANTGTDTIVLSWWATG
ncbi:MAG: hypothetical protein KGJ90_04100 [Patescibacteria group bacterium]|nr:hypothetical protein [Patescibacteria group bacterium]